MCPIIRNRYLYAETSIHRLRFFFVSLIAVKPVLTISQPLIMVIESDPAVLNVQVDALPFPDDVVVTSPSQEAIVPLTIFNKNSSITIIFTAVSRYNNGSYAVTANSNVGSGSEDFDLLVLCEYGIEYTLFF